MERAAKGPQVIVSRAHRSLLRRLFELEVPEIAHGSVEIKSIAREGGHRSKVAVHSRLASVDPIGACAVWGSSPFAWPEIVPAVSGAIKDLAASGFRAPFAVADGRMIHDSGGSEVQELAFVLAAGVAYLRALEGAGVALEDARNMVYARLSAAESSETSYGPSRL